MAILELQLAYVLIAVARHDAIVVVGSGQQHIRVFFFFVDCVQRRVS